MTWIDDLRDYLSACPDVGELAEAIVERCQDNDGRVFLFGNGGGHACAAHWATDMHKATEGMLQVRAPAESAAMLTMAANDYNWDRAFSQLMPPVAPLDTVIVFSASGRSLDILSLVDACVRHCTVVGFFGAVTPVAGRCDEAAAFALEPEDAENAWTIYGHQLSRELRKRWAASELSS